MLSHAGLKEEAERRIDALGPSNCTLSVISLSAPHLPERVLERAVGAAATPYDAIGALADGSIAVFAMRPQGVEAGAGMEDRFLGRLSSALAGLCGQRASQPLTVRSVHRWASETDDSQALFSALFAAARRTVLLRGPSMLRASLR